MTINPSPIDGLFVVTPHVWQDDRGYFLESFNQKSWEALTGLSTVFVQDNQARSECGVLRGMHFQQGASAQAKLVRVIEGAVFDVAVDMRPDSLTRHQWFGVELSAENFKQLFVPRGFAHGYLVLSEQATFSYKCDNFYDRNAEGGLRFDDPKIGIEWPAVGTDYVLSEKDRLWDFL
ncbi:MAG: dTDP-4-dehydrorhamnose 3,5-epimerase [Bacteroidota bacterium]